MTTISKIGGWIVGILVAVILLTGCSGPEPGPNSDTSWQDLGGLNAAKMVTIQGVRCIVVEGYQSVAVSCEWSAP